MSTKALASEPSSKRKVAAVVQAPVPHEPCPVYQALHVYRVVGDALNAAGSAESTWSKHDYSEAYHAAINALLVVAYDDALPVSWFVAKDASETLQDEETDYVRDALSKIVNRFFSNPQNRKGLNS